MYILYVMEKAISTLTCPVMVTAVNNYQQHPNQEYILLRVTHALMCNAGNSVLKTPVILLSQAFLAVPKAAIWYMITKTRDNTTAFHSTCIMLYNVALLLNTFECNGEMPVQRRSKE